MQVLFAKNHKNFLEKTILYRERLKTYLKEVEQRIGKMDPKLFHPTVMEYITYMKWPIRQLEYSFVLKEALPFIKDGSRTFDAGCGVTVLAPFFARLRCEAYGGDFDKDIIENMEKVGGTIYDTKVNYSFQDLTQISFEDNTFDLITCVSVLEHIASPNDTRAVAEMLRVLKPGGKLIITVDFSPEEKWAEKWLRRINKVLLIGVKGQFGMIVQHCKEYMERQKVNKKIFETTRKANQAYNLYHINKNLVEPFKIFFNDTTDLHTSVTKSQVKRFWKRYWYERRLYDQPVSYISIAFVLKK